MARWSRREAEEQYLIEGWGDGLFCINGKGHLSVRPNGADGPEVDLFEVVESLRGQELAPPIVLRFPDILSERVERLHAAFASALADNELRVDYRGVYPIKVNQRRDVVQELCRAGRKHGYGLEVGSKAELLAALVMDPSRRSLLIVNGFKDRAFLEAACHAKRFKDHLIIVLDELGELDGLLEILDEVDDPPMLGMRLKLRSKAPGKWALSGGERSKFGLTIPEVLHAVERLREAGRLELLQMLHFHIGSQISNIRRVGEGVREAARLHTELVRMGVPLRWLDCGGGMGVDYDGSSSSASNSCNYTPEEYAGTVVATVKDVCDDAEVPVPNLITESGRAAVAHHAVFITEVLRRVPGKTPTGRDDGPFPDDPTPLANLYAAEAELGPKNVFEVFHDALQIRSDLYALYDLGHLDLPGLGRSEALLRRIFERVQGILETEDETETEEYAEVRAILRPKLVCNFSLFQSLPDVWGVKQQFPILPLHRLRERPTEVATIADITCDSDGEVRRFIGSEGTQEDVPVHPPREGPYYLAVPLVGAYQDSLGDYHNLFGETNEAWVELDGDGWTTSRHHDGSRVAEMLEWVRYKPSDMGRRIRLRVRRLQEKGVIDVATAREMNEAFHALMQGPTYLGP